jgi:hypothetical protein
LGDRLRQVVHQGTPRVQSDQSGDQVDQAGPCRPGVRARVDARRVAEALAGRAVDSGDGTIVVVDRFYAADDRHGMERIGTLVDRIEAGSHALAVLGRAWPGRVSASYSTDLCFLDLETTGLAGGAGTQAFLVGCAVPEDGGLRVRQFLLPGFEHERGLLSQVASWTSKRGTLVTFNGRSFDLPLIETRYLLHRLSFPLGEVPHLDMLHPARRLWKQRPTVAGPPLDDDSCRLSVLERHLAGYHRVGDVPGFELPSRYFRFVRDGRAGPLESVLEHNRMDLLSLALVTSRTLALIDSGPSATTQPRECLGLGRVYERAALYENAEVCFKRSAELAGRVGREPDVEGEALRRLALCRRRAGRTAEAAQAWQQLIAVPGCPVALRREAREALAIHHEHRSRDLATARTHALDVLAQSTAPRWREQAEYRLRRLDRKMARRQRGGLIAALDELLLEADPSPGVA